MRAGMYTKQTTVFIGMVITCGIMYPVESEKKTTKKQGIIIMELLCHASNI
jgi:hypothetical protein